jgi:hypothetical protein
LIIIGEDDGDAMTERELELALRNNSSILNPFFGSKPKDWLDSISTLYIPLSDNFSMVFALEETAALLLVSIEYRFTCFTFTLLKFVCFAKTCEENKGNCVEDKRNRYIVSNNAEDNGKTDDLDNL